MRRFVFTEGTSSKFWEIAREASSVTVRFGKLGTNGQTQNKPFASDAVAQREHDKLVLEKTKKGYVEEKSAASPAKSAPEEEDGGAPKAKAPKKAAASTKAKEPAAEDPGWVDAGGGYALSLREGKLVCRKGAQTLASVPKTIKEGELAEQLLSARDFLASHDKECIATVEAWMLRSLPAPRGVLEAVWVDPSWRCALENAVVVPIDAKGAVDADAAGFFRGVSERGVGVVNLDGETAWIDAPSVMLPHPILLESLEDFRQLATELSLTQGIAQLFRETFPRPVKASDAAGATSLSTFSGGKFEQLNHGLAHAKKLGYRVTGGSAVTRVWERGSVFEARFWIGADDPSYEAWTGELVWVDDKSRSIVLSDVPAISFSEGVRMASAIYAARVVAKEASDA